MLKRKYIFISLAIILLAGLVFVLAALRMYENDITTEAGKPASADTENAALVDTKDNVRHIGSIPDSSSKTSASDDNRDGRNEKIPFVLNLLKRSITSPSFGSFLVRSIIYNSTAPESSRATIEDVNAGTSRMYSINNILSDSSKIADIQQDYVVLEKSGVRKRIYFTVNDSYAVGRRGYRKINDNEYDLNPYRVFRGDADRVLDFSMDVYSRDGNMEGIQVSGIERNTLPHNLGLKDGDVLLEVNGKPMDSLLSSVKSCMNAYNSDDLQLKIQRGNSVIDLQYHLFWQGQGAWTPTDVLNSKAISSLFNSELASHLF